MITAPPIRIVGGGMTGLTLAYRLSRRGLPVVVHERDPYLGGLAAESTLGGVPVERFYHCILPTDTALLGLLDELGLSGDVCWSRTRTGFYAGGRLLDMTTTADFIRFRALRLSDRVRLAWTIAYCAMNRDWRRLDGEPVGPFLRRHGGERLFRAIWEPLLVSKLGPHYDRFAASFIWATVNRMLSARKAKGRSEKLGFVSGRYGKVFIALRKAIEAKGGEVVAGQAVDGIRKHHNGSAGWSIVTGNRTLPASGIALCVPATVAVPWVEQALPDAAVALKRVEYLGVVCETLLVGRSVVPYYVLNLTDTSLPFTGVIELSNLTGTAEFGGRTVVYLPRYRDNRSADWGRDDRAIHEENMAGLRRIVPDLQDRDILHWQVNRAGAVQPIHPVGWGSNLPPVKLAPGLAYVATAQIHPWPVFNDEVVRNVDTCLPDVLQTLGDAPQGEQAGAWSRAQTAGGAA